MGKKRKSESGVDEQSQEAEASVNADKDSSKVHKKVRCRSLGRRELLVALVLPPPFFLLCGKEGKLDFQKEMSVENMAA
jgi:hypothetical protein